MMRYVLLIFFVHGVFLLENNSTETKPSDNTPNKNNVSDTQIINNVSSKTSGSKTDSEDKKQQHQGREHVIDIPPSVANNTSTSSSKMPENKISENVTPVVLPKNASIEIHKSVVRKQGVNFTDLPVNISTAQNTSSTTVKLSTTTTPKPIPQKPKITESDDVEVANVSLNKNMSNLTQTVSPSHLRTSGHNEIYMSDKLNRSADYVVPIVAVILSVPLVAIAISFIYKRTADWWTHRNYRRMDFLIEGMYNN